MVRAGLGSDGENCMTERLSVIHRTNIRGLIIMKLNSFHGIKKKKKTHYLIRVSIHLSLR